MKKSSRMCRFICCILCMVMLLSSCGSIAKSVKIEKTPKKNDVVVTKNTAIPSVLPSQEGVDENTSEKFLINYTELARNSNSILYADTKKGYFALQDIVTEKIWYSTPNNSELDELTTGTERMEMRSQLLVYFILKEEEGTVSSYKVENSQSGSVGADKAEVTLIDNGIRVDYGFKKTGFTIPVTYTLTENTFKAEILVDEINEGDNAYLIGINLLPTFGAGDWDDSGYLFIPDGSGALMKFNGHSAMNTAYNYGVYGEEKNVKQYAQKLNKTNIKMPVFGTVMSDSSLMGIITDGDGAASLSVLYGTSDCGYNAVSSVFNYRVIDSKEMYSKQGGISTTLYRVSKTKANSDLFSVEYRLLNGENSGYVGMAEEYRRYLCENGMLEKVETKPLLNLEVYGAAELSTSFLGIKYRKTQVLTTFEQAKEIIEGFNQKGISNIGVRYVGFSGDGILNRRLNTETNIISKLGSLKEYLSLSDKATIYSEFDIMRVRKEGNGISFRNDITRTVFDYKGEQKLFSKVVWSPINEDSIYLLNGKAIYGAATRLASNYKKAGFKKLSSSNLGNLIYSDFALENGMFKDEFQDYMKESAELIASEFGKIAFESANAYAFKYAERIWAAPSYSSGYDIFTTDVPFYQIVLHGNVALTSPCIMQSQDPVIEVLKAVETGSELLFACTYEDTTSLIGSRFEEKYSTQYRNWVDWATEVYLEYLPILEKVHDSTITSHTEISDGVFVTGFKNGVYIAVNYNDTDVALPSGEVIAAKKYCEIKGGDLYA